MTTHVVEARDEGLHDIDEGCRTWNESWFFSWIDADGGPAGFFRVGVMPNQGRAMLWGFVHVDGRWLGVEQSRLASADIDLSDGISYSRWGLDFGWQPDPPLEGARYHFSGDHLVRTGPAAGSYVRVAVDLRCTATGLPVATSGGDDDDRTTYPTARFEQSLEVTGVVTVDGQEHQVDGGAHRDRSWGPREWRQMFTLGDLQGRGTQLYFVGRTFPGLGMGFLRSGAADLHPLVVVDGAIDFDDAAQTFRTARLRLEGDGQPIEVTMTPITPSVCFDMAHTCAVPESWLYYRTLVEARVTGWDAPVRGWFESSRYGIA